MLALRKTSVACGSGLLLAGLLAAHSAWPDLHSVRSMVTCAEPESSAAIAGCTLEVTVTLEVPMAEAFVAFQEMYEHLDLAAELRAGRIEELESAFRARQFERLAERLSARLDGVLVEGTWKPTDLFGNGYGLDGFFVYELRLDAVSARLERPGTVTVRIDAFPRRTVMYSHVVDTDSLEVIESSVVQPPPGPLPELGSEEEIDLWSDDDERRVFRATVVPRQTAGAAEADA